MGNGNERNFWTKNTFHAKLCFKIFHAKKSIADSSNSNRDLPCYCSSRILFLSGLIRVMCFCWRHTSMLNIPHYEPQKQNRKIIISTFISRNHIDLFNWVMKNQTFISWKRLNFIYACIVHASVGIKIYKITIVFQVLYVPNYLWFACYHK